DDGEEVTRFARPVVQDLARSLGPRLALVRLDDPPDDLALVRVRFPDGHELRIDLRGERLRRVVDEGLAPGHPGPQVVPDRTEDHHPATGHVLARVHARAFDDGERPGVPDGEPCAGAARAVELAAGRAIQDGVPDEDGIAGVTRRRLDDDASAAHALPDVVVRFADERELDTRREEGTEGLSGLSGEGHE